MVFGEFDRGGVGGLVMFSGSIRGDGCLDVVGVSLVGISRVVCLLVSLGKVFLKLLIKWKVFLACVDLG